MIFYLFVVTTFLFTSLRRLQGSFEDKPKGQETIFSSFLPLDSVYGEHVFVVSLWLEKEITTATMLCSDAVEQTKQDRSRFS